MRRLLFPALLGLAVYFAVLGGEYSIFDLRRTHEQTKQEQEALARLNQEIDSLAAWADSLEVDSATLERLARERLGMVKEGEVLYRFTQPSDSTEEPGERHRP